MRIPIIIIGLLILLTQQLSADGFFTTGQEDGRWWLYNPAYDFFS